MKKTIALTLQIAVFSFVAFGLAACGGKGYTKDFRTDKTNKTNATGTMKPYTVNGKTYYPTVVGVGETATGVASWYGPGFHGKKTSNGEVYNQNAFTAAHKTLPMNTILSVTNLDNGRKTTVRINDRGPFVDNRIIDVSKAAATRLDMLQTGTAPVKLEVIGFDSTDVSPTPAAQEQSSEISASEQNTTTPSAGAVSAFTDIPEVSEVSTTSFEGGGFMVQIGAFKNKESAQDIVDRYKSYKGYSSYSRVSSRDGLTRVFLKGFKSENEAKDFVREGDFPGAFVVRE